MLPSDKQTSPIQFINSETGTLRRVVIGRADTFLQCPAPIINERQKQHYSDDRMPDKALVQKEYDTLVNTLVNHNVEVLQPAALEGVPDQLMARDIAFVVQDQLVITNMSHPSRQTEHLGLRGIVHGYPDNALFVPDDIDIEGGDIIVDGECIFVGLGQRSTPRSVAWLEQQFPDFTIVPLPLVRPADGADVLHLDCTFLPVGEHHALIFHDGFADGYDELKKRYTLLPVTREEQQELATNVLSLSQEKVLSRRNATRINTLLTGLGIEVVPIDFNEALKTGGSVRCASMPLWRE